MLRRPSISFILILLISVFFSLKPTEVCALEDYLIVRIVDAEYPSMVKVYDDELFTLFYFPLYLQIENPTQLNIEVLYGCSPFLIPFMNADLVNKNLKADVPLVRNWPVGMFIIPPGIRNSSVDLLIAIDNYANEIIPLGRYEIWYNYANCTTVSVPVVTKGMYIQVSQTNITYFFEYNNDTRIVSPSSQLSSNQANYSLSFFIFFVLIVTFSYKLWKRSKKKKVSSNQ